MGKQAYSAKERITISEGYRLRAPRSCGMTIRRMKTHTGATGFVYQYYFVGKRPALKASLMAPATEYVFDVTSDRKVTFAASIFLKDEALAAWSELHGRELNDPEQYAAAKMRLLQAFDEVTDMQASAQALVVDSNNIDPLLSPLGLD